jgi:dTDP-4-dehydrorhamnose reductase
MVSLNSSSSVLIVGADGVIGSELLRQFRQIGARVWGTTRRRELAQADRPYLNLADDIGAWQAPGPVSLAVLSAGISKIETCRREPEATAIVNVEGVTKLARKLTSDGALMIYLSTNQVFDGSRANRAALDSYSAATEYGRQKADVEQRLLALDGATCILRLTKVVQPDMPLLRGWCESLREGRPIHPFTDMVMAPIPLSFVVEAIQRLGEERLTGIFQASGAKDVTFAEVAYHIAERIGAPKDLVQPISVSAAGLPPEAAPLHTTLDATALRAALGLAPPDVWTTIDSALSLQ